MLIQGVILMVAGMGVVLAFLSVMVLLMSCSRPLVRHIDHLLPDDAPPAPVEPATDADEPDAALALAIAVAGRHA